MYPVCVRACVGAGGWVDGWVGGYVDASMGRCLCLGGRYGVCARVDGMVFVRGWTAWWVGGRHEWMIGCLCVGVW